MRAPPFFTSFKGLICWEISKGGGGGGGLVGQTPSPLWALALVAKFDMLVFWILGQFFGLMSSFLSRRQSCFSTKSHCESILLILMLYKTTHLVLPFSYYTLINLMMLSVIHYLCSCFYYLLKVWVGVYFVVKAKINLWTCIWPARPCGMRHVDCWFQCWKNSTCSIWLFK